MVNMVNDYGNIYELSYKFYNVINICCEQGGGIGWNIQYREDLRGEVVQSVSFSEFLEEEE